MNNGKYDFVCIDSESEECRRDIEAHDKSKKWAKTLECGGADHSNRRRILMMPTISPFVDGNGHPLDHETAHAVFKVLEYRRMRRYDFCFVAAMASIFIAAICIDVAAICIDAYVKHTDDYIMQHGADEYFPAKTINDCKLKRILYFSGKSREYVCPDGSLVVVGKDVRNKDGE